MIIGHKLSDPIFQLLQAKIDLLKRKRARGLPIDLHFMMLAFAGLACGTRYEM